MYKPSSTSIVSSILLILSLVACEAIPSKGTPTTAPTLTMTSVPSLTPTVSTPMIPPATLTSTATPLIPVSSAPDGLRMAYPMDGNLYFQDGSKSPLQLTYSGGDSRPIGFSENGEKLFFLRGNNNNLYFIHVDGTNEQALATEALLNSTNFVYSAPTKFCDPILVPHSPFILFRTCSYPRENTIIYEDDLFIADTDTNQAKLLLPRGYGGGDRIPSPDGKKLAIDHPGYIDILAIDGSMIRHKLATYTISEPWPLGALVYWTADSHELIVALPINTFYDSSPPPMYEIWRYSVDTGVGTKIPLDPSSSGIDPVWVSPDGNWLLYTNYDERPFYLVNLREGHARPYQPDQANQLCGWGPDSVHFLYRGYQPDRSGLYLASVNASPIFVGEGECVGWLDANRFVYYNFKSRAYILNHINGESVPILIGGYTSTLHSYDCIVFFPSAIK